MALLSTYAVCLASALVPLVNARGGPAAVFVSALTGSTTSTAGSSGCAAP